MDQELRAALDEIKAEVAQHRSETAAEFQAVRAQLGEIERLTRYMADNLLSPHEQRELKRKTG